MVRLITAVLSLLAATAVLAQNEITVRALAVDSATGNKFHEWAKEHNLPEWVMEGGTGSPSRPVTIDNKSFQVMSACKPHACAKEQIAVLYLPEQRKISGVFSTQTETGDNQTLIWLNSDNENEISLDGKTVLFTALSGSLENHTASFNLR